MKAYDNLLLLLLIAGAAIACSEKEPKYNVFQPLSQTESETGFILNKDSVQYLQTRENRNCINLSLPECDYKANLDTVFSSYKFIPLETNKHNLVGQITKIIRCDNCFCILDRSNNNVFIFELDGKYRCKLGVKGHSKKEYLDTWNVTYDEYNKLLVLLDLTGRKLMYYDLQGNLQHTESLYFLFTDIEFTKDNIFINTGNAANGITEIIDSYNLLVCNREYRPIRMCFHVNDFVKSSFSYAPKLKKIKDRILYDDLLSDTIWDISTTSKKPFVTIVSKDMYKFSKEEKQNMTDKLYESRLNQSVSVIDWHISTLYISILTNNGNGIVRNALYSRKSKRYKVFGNNLKGRRLGDFLAMSTINDVYDENSFIKIVEPIDIIKTSEEKACHSILSKEEREMIEGLSADSNPVLMIESITEF